MGFRGVSPVSFSMAIPFLLIVSPINRLRLRGETKNEVRTVARPIGRRHVRACGRLRPVAPPLAKPLRPHHRGTGRVDFFAAGVVWVAVRCLRSRRRRSRREVLDVLRRSRDGRGTVPPGRAAVLASFLDAVRACPSHIGLEHEKPAQRAAFPSPWYVMTARPVSDASRAVCAVPRCRLFYALRCPVPLRQRETYGSVRNGVT